MTRTIKPTCPFCNQPTYEIRLEAWTAGNAVVCPSCGKIVNQQVMRLKREHPGEDYDHLSAAEAAAQEARAEQEQNSITTPKPSNSTVSLPEPAAAVLPSELTVKEAKRRLKLFNDVKKSLLSGEDLEIINDKAYICKSGWRKIAMTFNISTELIGMHPMSHKSPIEYRATVKAVAPNGRFAMGVGYASENEKEGWSKHKAHDIMTLAEVRATNRAISDLVGCAEISAEEVRALKKK